MNNNLIRIKNISKTYYTKEKEIVAIKDISFEIPHDTIIAIVGPSGCGKSTLLNIIGSLEKETSGEIGFQDKNIKLGYMFQSDCLFPWLTILDNCLLELKMKGILTDDKKKYVIKLLDDYGLKDFMNSYPDNLSGGMRQRVALIRTLAISPDILLLDEPFSALDFDTRLLVSDDVYQMIRKEKKSAIIITHDIEEAISFADIVIVLSKRPATIKKGFHVQIDKSILPTKKRGCVEFQKYYRDIWEVFDHEI